jgi:DNA polymerase III subunit epsilon
MKPPPPPPSPQYPARWVVFDTETTGTTPSRDRMVSIAALAIQDQEIVPEDSFECMVRIPFNSSAVVVHGITREQTQREGIEEAEAVRLFECYVGDSCLIGHHVAFDVIVLNHARARAGLPLMQNGALDLMELFLALETAGILPPRSDPHNFSLDGLLEHFGLGKAGRHTAMGDSFLTAMIFLKLLKSCRGEQTLLLQQAIRTDIGLGQV